MHFGKRLAEFVARDPRLKSLDYKQLKRFIKSSDFAGFLHALQLELAALNACISEYLDFCELRAALVQQQLVTLGLAFKESRLHVILDNLNAKDHLTTAEAVQVLASSKTVPADLHQAISELANGRDGLLEFVEINACGVRKIVKKFAKRAIDYERPNYNHAIDGNRIVTLVSTIDCMISLANIQQASPTIHSEELKLFMS